LPLDDQELYDHLSGKHTVGIYPIQKDGICLRFYIVMGSRIKLLPHI
jgi:hypothetical protein